MLECAKLCMEIILLYLHFTLLWEWYSKNEATIQNYSGVNSPSFRPVFVWEADECHWHTHTQDNYSNPRTCIHNVENQTVCRWLCGQIKGTTSVILCKQTCFSMELCSITTDRTDYKGAHTMVAGYTGQPMPRHVQGNQFVQGTLS